MAVKSVNIRMPFLRAFALFVMAAVPASAFAQQTHVIPHLTYDLSHEDHKRRSQASWVVENAQAGDTIVFRWIVKSGAFGMWSRPEETSFRVGKLLGKGNTTRIFELPDHPGKVLRVPTNFYDWEVETNPMAMFHSDWILAQKKLFAAGVAVPKLHDHRGGLFAVVEQVTPSDAPTFADFLQRPEHFTKAQRREMLASLMEFARTTAQVFQLGDFRADQMVYATRAENGNAKPEWMILDFFDHYTKIADRPPRGWPHRQGYGSTIFGSVGDLFPNKFLDPEKKTWVEIVYHPFSKAWSEHVLRLAMDAVHDERNARWLGKPRQQVGNAQYTGIYGGGLCAALLSM